MSNNWQKDLLKRCEDVGWQVTQGTNHMKVADAKGKLLFSVSVTSSDRRAQANAMGVARRAGLEVLETDLKLKKERDRLMRIELDRTANGAGDVNAAASVPTPASLNGSSNVSRTSAVDPQLGDVDGVPITVVAPAMYKTPVMREPTPLADGEELLLADGRVVYRCVKVMSSRARRQGPCHMTFESVTGLSSHMGAHSRSRRPREIAGDDEPDVANAPIGVASKPVASKPIAAEYRDDVAAVDRMLAQLQTEIQKIADAVPGLTLEISTIRDAVRRIADADADARAKAAQFDVISGAFKSVFQGE